MKTIAISVATDRPTAIECANEILRMAGIQFDPEVASLFLSIPNETWEAIREQTADVRIIETFAGISIEN